MGANFKRMDDVGYSVSSSGIAAASLVIKQIQPMAKPLFHVRILLLMASVFLCSIPLFAQEKEKIHSVKFRLMALPALQGNKNVGLDGEDTIIRDVYYASGKETKKIPTIPYLSQSSQYKYEGPSPLVFFRERTRVNGERVREVLARVDVSNGKRNILILVLPRKGNGGNGFGTYTLTDDLDSFPLNSFRIVNFSNSEVACMLDNLTARVKAGDESVVVLQSKEPRMVPFKLISFDSQSNEWKPISSTSVPFYGISRVLCLILPDPSSQKGRSRPTIILDLGPEADDEEANESENSLG